MSYQLQVLCALVRLSRRSSNITNDVLLARVGGSAATLSNALRSLEALGLLTLNKQQAGATPRLTLDGLALGQASSAAIAEVRNESRAPRLERRSASRRMTGVPASTPSSSRVARTTARRAA